VIFFSLIFFFSSSFYQWLVVEARTLSDALRSTTTQVESTSDPRLPSSLIQQQQLLDALGYDEAAQYVYGMHYDDWKKLHSKMVSDEKMQTFNDSKSLWAKHDKTLLAKRSEMPPVSNNIQQLDNHGSNAVCIPQKESKPPSSLLSNVCCQDPDEQNEQPPPPPAVVPPSTTTAVTTTTTRQSREVPPYQPPSPPNMTFSLGILTVSDRASTGLYETGDLSGPAVKAAIDSVLETYGERVKLSSVLTGIVSDDIPTIQEKIKEWTDQEKIQLILTTGGTGFSSRDVTPEATNEIVDRVCDGLLTFCTMECAKVQPLASLSRGSAGVRGTSMIVNLPGNPKGVQEIIPILLPLVLHAVSDLVS